jgi:hypothetical protein
MLPLLQKSNRFQEEYKKFRSTIDSMPAGTARSEAEQLLNKLMAEIRQLDTYHNDMIMNRQLGTMSADIRDRIANLRKRLDKKLSDWQRANQA